MGITPIWPEATARDAQGAIAFHGITAEQLLNDFGSPLYVLDLDEVRARARRFAAAAAHAFSTTTTHVSYAGKAFLSKEMARIVTEAGLYVDTCTMGEMRIALAAGVPGRRLVLHGNNKSDAEIELAITEGFAKIVIDEPDEPARIATIARRLGKRARVMLRVTTGIHAGGHEFISTAHEDQKFGIALLPAGADTTIVDGISSLEDVSPAAANAIVAETRAQEDGKELRHDIRYPYDLNAASVTEGDKMLAAAMELVANGPAVAVLREIAKHSDELELVGIHSHIGSNIHDADAFIHAARRMMLLRKTFYATNGYTLPEVDLGGGYSVAYTDGEDSMDIEQELDRLAAAVAQTNRLLGMPMPVISFEAHVRLGRRRHERQHPPCAVRRGLHGGRGEPRPARRHAPVARRRHALRVGRHRGEERATAERHPPRRRARRASDRRVWPHDGQQLQPGAHPGGRRRRFDWRAPDDAPADRGGSARPRCE